MSVLECFMLFLRSCKSTVLAFPLTLALCVGCSDDASSVIADAGPPDAPEARCPGSPDPHIVFLNRGGGSYTSGANDPATNTSAILTEDVTLSPPGIADGDWNEITSCVTSLLSDYNIAVVDSDPGAVVHQEIVVLKAPSEIGQGNGVDGISPFSCGQLNAIAFAFTTTRSNRQICEIAVGGVGRMTGIETVTECTDVFSNQVDGQCGDKVITDAVLQCGDLEPTPCQCAETVNPHELMTSAYGLCEG